MSTQQQLLERIISFCKDSEEVISLILIGSQARTEFHADQYSDLDLIMIVNDIDRFILSNDWVEKIGKHHVSFVEPTIGGQKERRILFDDALDVDFVIVAKDLAQATLASDDAKSILSKGYRFLINKENYTVPDQYIERNKYYETPSASEYANVVSDFWYHSVWTTKKLLRGELWAANFCVNSYMKWKLLWMIEHYEHAIHGSEYNTWYGGRFIDTWAEDEVKNGLSKSFSNYNITDMALALFETMDLFRTLAVKVALTNHYDYPIYADEYCSSWVHKKLEDSISVGHKP